MSPKAFLSPRSAANPKFEPLDLIVTVVTTTVAAPESNSSDLIVVVVTVVAVPVVVTVVNGSGVFEYPGTVDCSGHVIFRSTGSSPRKPKKDTGLTFPNINYIHLTGEFLTIFKHIQIIFL